MSNTDATHLHPATTRKRQRARADGHVAKSSDLTSAIVLLGGLTSILFFGDQWCSAVMEITQRKLGNPILAQTSIDWLQDMVVEVANVIALVLIPIAFFVALLPMLVHLIQTRFLFHLTGPMPTWSRLGLSQWTNRAFTLNNVIRIGFGLTKLLLVLAMAGWFFTKHGSEFIALATIPFEDVASTLGSLLVRVMIEIAFALTLVAVVDLLYQRRRYERDLMMTAEELREESHSR